MNEAPKSHESSLNRSSSSADDDLKFEVRSPPPQFADFEALGNLQESVKDESQFVFVPNRIADWGKSEDEETSERMRKTSSDLDLASEDEVSVRLRKPQEVPAEETEQSSEVNQLDESQNTEAVSIHIE